MRTATPAAETAQRPEAPRARGLLLRKCACGGKTGGVAGECDECKKKKLLQRRASGSAPAQVPAVVHDVLRSPGRPLDPAARAFMEPRFGRDFSNVRIHDDAQAARSARSVHAQAWTVGDHIAFAPGKYDPASTAGRRLLAHELAHTVQQSGLQRSSAGVTMPAAHEDAGLEADADLIAYSAMYRAGGLPSTPAVSAAPRLSRAPIAPANTTTVPLTINFSGVNATFNVTPENNWQEPGGDFEASFTVDKLLVPMSKGAPGVQAYKNAAIGGNLQSVLEMSGTSVNRTASWQERDDTAEMRDNWLAAAKVTGDRDKAWNAAWVASGGSAATSMTFPRTAGGTCQMDHIIELQLGGGNNAENLVPLDAAPNRHSGGFLRDQTWTLAEKIATDPVLTPVKPRHLRMRFKNAVSSPYSSTVAPPDCLTCAAATRTAAGTAAAAVAGAPGAPPPTTAPYTLTARDSKATSGGVNTLLQIPASAAAGTVINIYDDPVNRASGLLISGLLLKTLTKAGPGKKDMLNAELDTAANAGGARKTRLPISLQGAPPGIPLEADAQPLGLLRQKSTSTKIPYTFPFLSPGVINKLAVDANGKLTFSGTLNPTVPFLPKQVNVAYQNEVFNITSKLDRKSMRPPIPGFTYTADPVMAVSYDSTNGFTASGDLAFALGKIATGSVKVGADASGITATGTLNAVIPGVDKASTTITYSNGAWSGQIVVESSQIKLPYVQNARLVLDLDKDGLKPSGEVSLLFPRELGTATLGFSREDSRFIYKGAGRFKVPGLHEVDVNARYDGTALTATASNIGFKWKGLNGKMDVTYKASAGSAGTVSGNGSLTFTKGDFTGEIAAKLNDSGKFSGKGTVKYPFKFRGTRVDATAGIILNEDQSVRVEGAIKLPQPVTLFRKFGDTRSIFHISKQIPIPGASIGPVGLQAVIEGGVDVNYGIGPGELRNVALTAAFNPLAPNPDPNVAFHCDLHIPASAGFTGTIGGGLAVSAGIASVSGTVTVSAGLNLNATAGGPLDVNYESARFELSAKPGIKAALNLGLSLDAHARAEAGVGPFSVSTEKTWNLGKRNINLAEFSMAVPIRYASNEEFRAPSLSSIEWGPAPQLDFSSILKQLFDGATPSETSA